MEANGQLQQRVHVVRVVQGGEAQLEETVDDITTYEVCKSIARIKNRKHHECVG